MDDDIFDRFAEGEGEDSDDDIEDVLADHIVQVLASEEAITELEDLMNKKHGGSRIGRSPNIVRDHQAGHDRIWGDYFSAFPVFPPALFRRRFRMTQNLFMRIHNTLLQQNDYFVQKPDAIGRVGLSSIQKMTAALHMMCYGSAGDAVDEYIRIGESTAILAFKHFVETVVNSFSAEYLRAPTEADVRKHMEINRRRGFVGMFGSLDCTHWIWKNCLVAHQGQFRDKDGLNSIILEAVATSDLWIWHAFAGIPGSNNDINVIDRSPLLVNMLNGVAPNVRYTINGHEYSMFYHLTDGIYPDWSIFVKTISDPQGAKRKWFAKKQESVRKDVERCFGVLQARFQMVRHPARWWSRDHMQLIWKAAVILHNMIIEDEATDPDLTNDYLFERNEVQWQGRPRAPLTFAGLTHNVGVISNPVLVTQLQEDLVEHLWQVRGDADEE